MAGVVELRSGRRAGRLMPWVCASRPLRSRCPDTRPGTELINDEVVVDDAPLEFELHGTCAFTREFDYSG